METSLTSLRLAVAIGVGLLISTMLLVMEALTDHALFWLGLQMPGINAADFVRGIAGGSALVGVAIAWLVNALVYATGVYILLAVVDLARQDARA